MTWKEQFNKEYGEFQLCDVVSFGDRERLQNFIEKRVITELIEDIPASAVTDEKWENGEWVRYRSYHSVQEQLRAKWLSEETK